MVYGYDTNEEFIDKSYRFLEKLDKKNLWNKDTLIIGLDKSVRPLTYTLKKISDLEKRKTPDIKFFNYSSYESRSEEENFKVISSHIKEKISSKKLSQPKNILILDSYVHTGKTLENMNLILKNYFFRIKNKPDIYFASLSSKIESINGKQNYFKKKKHQIIFIDKEEIEGSGEKETGIEDKFDFWEVYNKKRIIQESKITSYKRSYKEFVQNRKQLSEDIKEYVAEKQNLSENKKQTGGLEKTIRSFSILLLASGIFLSSPNITGNIIGNNFPQNNFLGIGLFVLGILGLFFSRKKVNYLN